MTDKSADVLEFTRTFGQHIADERGLPDKHTRRLRVSLIVEEANEFVTADRHNDEKEIADALADLDYVVLGTGIAYGLDLSRVDHYTEGVITARPVMVAGVPAHARDRVKQLLAGAMQDYLKGEGVDDLDDIEWGLLALRRFVVTTAAYYGIPLDAVHAEVHRSNMAKAVDGIVIRDESGKVRKPIGWQPPDIARVLDEHNANTLGRVRYPYAADFIAHSPILDAVAQDGAAA